MTTKMESMKKHNQKLEKQLRSLKKYLSELPTRDEYKTLQVNNLLFFLFWVFRNQFRMKNANYSTVQSLWKMTCQQ